MDDWIIVPKRNRTVESVLFDWFVYDIYKSFRNPIVERTGSASDMLCRQAIYEQFCIDLPRSTYSINGRVISDETYFRTIIKEYIPNRNIHDLIYILGTQSVCGFLLERLHANSCGENESIIDFAGEEGVTNKLILDLDVYQVHAQPPLVLLKISKSFRKIEINDDRDVIVTGIISFDIYIDLNQRTIVYELDF